MKILFKAQWKKYKRTLLGIFLLTCFSVLSLASAVSTYQNSYASVHAQMERLGYGDLTVWVSGTEADDLKQQITSLDIVEDVSVQPLIYSGYSLNGEHSDDEGELLYYDPAGYDYHFFNDALDGYKKITEISSSEIYLSPSMLSSFDAQIGDTITFEISRENAGISFTVAGYFEDPFMGSSMIDMKSFLISQRDYQQLLSMISQTDAFDQISRTGAMLHITQSTGTVRELNEKLSTDTSISVYREMSYSFETIQGYMLLLQNILSGFLFAFGVLLMIVVIILLINLIRSVIRDERKELAILKVIGKEKKDLEILLLMTYGLPACLGALTGALFSAGVIACIRNITITSTGILFSDHIDVFAYLLIILSVCIINILIILFFSREIMHIKPMQAIRDEIDASAHFSFQNTLHQNTLQFSLALRQVLTQQGSYIGILVVTILLTLFMNVINTMRTWVGDNGEGLMDSFSVARHDIGIQPTVSDFDYAEAEALINQYTAISDTYSIAMQDGTINGEDYTINVLDDARWFHILEGRTTENENELVITEYVAEDLSAGIGETVTVSSNGRSGQYTVVGIYECANGMGANVGMQKEGYARIGNVNDNIWCHHYILQDDAWRDVIMQEMQDRYRLAADIHDNSWSGLEGIVNSLHLVIALMYALTIMIIFITVSLSVHNVLAKETYSLAIYKTLGMTSHQLRLSFAYRYLFVTFTGTLIGVIASICLDSSIVSLILKNFGIGGFYASNDLLQIFLSSFIILAFSFLFSFLETRTIRKIPVSHLLTME